MNSREFILSDSPISIDRIEEVVRLNAHVEADEDILDQKSGIWIIRLADVDLYEVRLFEPRAVQNAS